MIYQIADIANDPEVSRLERLAATYRARLAELGAERSSITTIDQTATLAARAAAVASGSAYRPVRSVDAIDDEVVVLAAAIRRVDAEAADARALATIRISRDAGLAERAAELRSAVARSVDDLLDALAAADEFVGALDRSGISATGTRWPGAADGNLRGLLAALRLDLGGVPAGRLDAVERLAGRRGEPALVELQARPAPVPKTTLRRKIASTIGEIVG